MIDLKSESAYRALLTTIDKTNIVYFWNVNEENEYLSNWYRSEFEHDDFLYQHVEQYMMAQKAKLFHDSRTYTAVLRSDAPDKCKKLGRQVSPFDSKVWDEHKYDILHAGCLRKFQCQPELAEWLLDTGDSLLVEASPYDKIWGIGLDRVAAAKTDPLDWPGENLMGRILMEVRDELK